VAGVAQDGSLLDFHATEVRARQKIRANAQRSLLVIDQSKFGRKAPALGDHITDMDTVILDRCPGPEFSPLLDQIRDRLIVAEGTLA
jgi:DeoR family glycerol-3-phosphate regulon repressor